MSADRLREAARVLRGARSGEFYQAVADWLDDEAEGDGRMPHRYPTPAPDGDVIAWACRACGEIVSEYSRTERTDCTIDWRGRDPHALAVADAILGGTK